MKDILGKVSNVSFYGSRHQEGHISAIWELMQRLRAQGVGVSVEKKLAGVLADASFRLAVHGIRPVTSLPAEAQVAVSVGGDGTFLRTARWIAGREIPILGINTGHLGFLTENSAADVPAVFHLLTSGEGAIERRLVLEVEVEGPGVPQDNFYPFALNEVAFLKGMASMIDIHVTINGYHLASYRADGLLVSTPTGSTAYNLSVGGPILEPTLQCMVLSPIAPHSLTLRPVVVGANSMLEATVESRAHDFRLSLDGRSATVGCGTRIKIKKGSHSVLTIRRPGENFASTLRTKLLWSR